MRWRFREGRERVSVRVELSLDADAPFARVVVHGNNAATDHRLRLRIATGLASPQVFADAMFGAVERPRLQVDAADAHMEGPLDTAPLHRYVSLFSGARGATVYSDGLCEYETANDGGVFITVLRSVGELSRADLPERPGNAGWPTRTPGAQCPGPFGGAFAILLHGKRTHAVIDTIECTADDVLLPLSGATLRSALDTITAVQGIALVGQGLAFSAMKESEQGQWTVLRCVNLLDRETRGRWVLPSPIREAHLARLDETITQALPTTGTEVEFLARPRETVTILVW
jgi:alpha-mannosidase